MTRASEYHRRGPGEKSTVAPVRRPADRPQSLQRARLLFLLAAAVMWPAGPANWCVMPALLVLAVLVWRGWRNGRWVLGAIVGALVSFDVVIGILNGGAQSPPPVFLSGNVITAIADAVLAVGLAAASAVLAASPPSRDWFDQVVVAPAQPTRNGVGLLSYENEVPR